MGKNGTYRLPVRAGKHVIKLIDLATGVTLFQSDADGKVKTKAGKDKEHDITAELAMVIVELAPTK